ncbi:MAG: DUF2935 domain-containing protein [Lachnospiraceae bacterium]|nr:DUF2935 domain-containing protein [Lachnospiraceae bacterium]
MRNYVITSMETHLFFARTMKEHSLFLLVALPAGEKAYRSRADELRAHFEKFLEEVVQLANGVVRKKVLRSGEMVTKFTEMAEKQTSRLMAVPIDMQITRAQQNMRSDAMNYPSREMIQCVRRLNQKSLHLLSDLILLKEEMIQEVSGGNLYTANYPLLVEHMLKEARLYCDIIVELEEKGSASKLKLKETEIFWNQIMMEHALFIRGLLDPVECDLMEKSDDFAKEYCRLLEEARKQDWRAMEQHMEMTKELTKEYRDFKEFGTKGVMDCSIRSIILSLLADHVLREANHYLRVLGEAEAYR